MAAMLLRRHLAALVLILSGCAQGPERVVEEKISDRPAPRGTSLLRDVMLSAHNQTRAEAGVPPLQWDSALVETADRYARELARTGRFAHARQPSGPQREGENLWTGTRGAYRFDEMAGHWIAEKRHFVNGVTPSFSRTGKWQDVSHYTQIIWRNATRVGCALASNRRDDYLVCRYSPPGNVVGQRTL
ncbi:CAP domain-containing protein [Sphingomonas sp.]|uniref:CAP domain-containing protein n=1 Tax=Sphingomonas sp. TaxID=28214 RepID=UPI0026298884|nr:CAP domain-containing protein [Sphingomonas sp.]